MAADAEWTMRTWSGALHRRVPITFTERSAGVTWASIERGAAVDDPTGSRREFPAAAVVCFVGGEWWNAIWLDGPTPDLHVDIAIPATITRTSVETIDLGLDVTREAGRVEIVDRVEFEHNRPFYPLPVIERAEAAALHVAELIESAAFPFDGSHEAHRANT